MSLLGRVGRMTTDEEERARTAAPIREARVAAARKQAGWTEIVPAERLVPRGPKRFGWLVDSETDVVFVLASGTWFDRGTLIADRVEGVHFFVDGDGDVRVLERVAVAGDVERGRLRASRTRRGVVSTETYTALLKLGRVVDVDLMSEARRARPRRDAFPAWRSDTRPGATRS